MREGILYRVRGKKRFESRKQRDQSPISQSKSINDKILWSNLERDLIECIQVHKIDEPLLFDQSEIGGGRSEVEVILKFLGMMNSDYTQSFVNQTGKAKEKLLLSKMISILTPSKMIPDVKLGISFENILIFCATVSNIEVPYKNSVK